MKRRGILIVACLLVWAATASADCGWVLWKSMGRAYSPNRDVEDVEAFDTRAACVDALTKLEKTLRTQRWHRVSRTVETGLFADDGPTGQDREEVGYVCRPVGMDLRGK
jgi:hypothetical protein